MTNPSVQKQPASKIIFIASTVVYILVVLVAAALLFIEPNGFSAQSMIFPLVAALLLSSVGIAYKFASKASSKSLAVVGTVALAVLLTFIGFFIVAIIGWCIALVHAQ